MHCPETEIVITRGGAEMLRRVVDRGEYVIGSSASCAIAIEGDTVAREHARVTINLDHALIEDLGTDSGTFVNGKAVSGVTRLWPNQKITIGQATIELRRLKAVPPPDVSLAPSTATVRRLLPEEFLRAKKYDIGGVVAEGGMGAILDAKEATTERTVAMKVMLHCPAPEDMARFIAEAKITAQLEHPGIVPVYELSVDENDNVFYTMKYVRGLTLRAVFEKLAAGDAETASAFPLPHLLTIFQKVCDAVAYAHSKGVIHRDLKPENVMVGDYGEVLVMDWGLAKSLGGRRSVAAPSSGKAVGANRAAPSSDIASATLAGSILGTPQYMAPEQARGEIEQLDTRADIYSLGALLFHILALRPPVEGDDAGKIVEKVGRGEIEPLFNRQSKIGNRKYEIPDSLAAVVRKAMALEREARYQSVEALQADVTAYQNGFATGAENAGVGKQFALLIKRNKTASIAAAIVLALTGGFTAKVISEGRLAQRVLTELRGTAPTFEAQSRALVAEGKLDDALAKIGYATNLAPKTADYHLIRANLFQSSQKLAEAAEEYRRVMALRPGDTVAKTNLELCERLLAENGGAAELKLPVQGQLLDALIAQHRDLEAAPLSKLLNRENDTAEATIRSRLASYATQKGWTTDRIHFTGTGFRVDLSRLQLGDPNVLRGLPIVELNLDYTTLSDLHSISSLPLAVLSIASTPISDLSPLHGLKLQELTIRDTNVRDLAPLAGMPLTRFTGGNCPYTDLSPLRGARLTRLDIYNAKVRDLSVVAGMPLQYVFLHGCDEVGDLSPLAKCPTIEKMMLPWDIRDIAFLAALPKLQQVEIHYNIDPSRWYPIREFLATYGPDVPEIKAARVALAAAGAKDLGIRRVAVDSNHQLTLKLYDLPISDLAPLHGLPIKELDISRTPVSNLEPLRGMPLTSLYLSDAQVRDVGILAEFPNLEILDLPPHFANIERLRVLSKLRYLSIHWDNVNRRPAQTAEEFWKEFDAKGSGRASK